MGLVNARRKAVLAAYCSLSLFSLSALAQTTQPAGNPRGGPLRPATNPASRPASTRPTTQYTTTAPADQFMMNFKDAPLDVVTEYLSSRGGFTIIKEGQVEARVNVMSKAPVSRQEAVILLDAALKSVNFAAVRQGNTLKIMPRDKAVKSNVPVHYGSNPKDIPQTDELITQVMPVNNVDASKLKEDLKPLIGANDLTANEGSNSIVMTDTSANIHRVAEIIFNLDQGDASTSGIRVVSLKYATAATVAKMVDTLFKGDAGGQMMDPRMMNGNGGPPPPPAGGAGGKRARGKVITAADERTNTLVITGPADALATIDDLISKLDSNPVPASIVKLIPLKYADAEAVSKLIASVFTPKEQSQSPFRFFSFYGNSDSEQSTPKGKATAAFDDRTNTLIVTAPAAMMPDIEEMVAKLDANPVAASSIHIFPLKFADSYSAAKLVNSIFNPSAADSGRTSERIYIYDEGARPAPTKAAKVNATSDDRTNAVIVTAPIESMKIITQVIAEIDARPGSEDTILMVHLRNAKAENLETVLNTLFGNINNGQNQNNQNGQNQNGPQQNGQSQFGNNQQQLGSNSGSRIGGNNQNGNNRNNRNNNQNRNNNNHGNLQSTFSELTGQVLVVADPDTNTLLVTTAVKFREEVKQIIHELDRPAAQVLIKVLIAEVTHDNSADFGTDFSVLNTRPNGNGQSFGGTFGSPGSGLVVNFLENNLNAQLHALAQQNKLDVLSRPYILASDNQAAEILVGQQVPYPTSNYTTGLGQIVSNYELKSVGIIIDVTPHINPDGQVILDVQPEISSLTNQTISVGPGIAPPVISDRSAFSRVAIRDGQTIVIGGLMQDQKTLTRSKIPLLGDLPLIGYAFGRTQVGSTKTELLIFLTPHVAMRPEALSPMSNDELQGTKLTPNAVRPGQFQEHLDGLRRGAVPDTQRGAPSPEVFEPRSTTQPGDEK